MPGLSQDAGLRSDGKSTTGGAFVQSSISQDSQTGFGGNPSRFNSTVLVFQLPSLPSGQLFTKANLRFSAAINGSPNFNAELHGLPRRDAATVLPGDFYAGPSDPAATLIQDNLLRSSSGLGATLTANRTTDGDGNIQLRNYLNAQYNGGAGAGHYVFLRFSMDTATYASSTDRYVIGMSDHSDPIMRPVIEYSTGDSLPPDLPDPRWMGHTSLSNNGSGRATGYEETNKIVSFGDKTHVSWLDSDAEGFQVRIRTLDRSTGEWSPTYTVGPAYDNHGGPALVVDSEGYLHITYGPHGPIQVPMRYRRSLLPNDASAWTKEEQFAHASTYPTMVCAPDDTLILTVRQSHRSKPWTVDVWTRPKNGSWTGPREILRSEVNGYSHFHESLAWSPDRSRLHLTYRQNHGDSPRDSFYVGYLYSPDLGKTWKRADGSTAPLPARWTETTEIATDNPAGPTPGNIHCGSLAVAPDGTLFAVVIRIDRDTTASHVDLMRLNAKTPAWTSRSLLPFVPKRTDGTTGHLRVGGFAINVKGEMFLILNQGNRTSTGAISYGDPSTEVFLLRSIDGGVTFSNTQISPTDPTTPNWHGTVEKDTGWNPLAGEPPLIYTAGVRGANNTSIVSNKVWYVELAALPGSDANGNGISNLMEFAFGLGHRVAVDGFVEMVLDLLPGAVSTIHDDESRVAPFKKERPPSSPHQCKSVSIRGSRRGPHYGRAPFCEHDGLPKARQ
ncbi:MAG: hypothetical protein HC888_01195 [Candidatus Competibacteraceae bacterium]|nr:hypothetical protein [Candidatus Competibacteraceae bacterium]